jgi:hypothetical protein
MRTPRRAAFTSASRIPSSGTKYGVESWMDVRAPSMANRNSA